MTSKFWGLDERLCLFFSLPPTDLGFSISLPSPFALDVAPLLLGTFPTPLHLTDAVVYGRMISIMYGYVACA